MAIVKKEIVISSDPVELEQVELFVIDIFDSYLIRRDLFCKVLVCLNEAVINSISHGNRFEESKKVVIQSFCCQKFLYFRVVDEGIGFDFNNLKDPTEFGNIRMEEGRGIFIMKNMSDGIIYRNKGNIVEFKIKTAGNN